MKPKLPKGDAGKQIKKARVLGRIATIIFSNPVTTIIFFVVIAIIIAICCYTVYQMNNYLLQLEKQYTSLTARQEESGSQFNKRLFFITRNADGTVSITIGYKNEEAMQTAQDILEDNENNPDPTAEQHNYDGSANGIQDMCNLLAGAQADLGITDFAAPSQFTEKEKAILISGKAVGLSDAACCGIIGNSNSEGGYGLQQYGKTSSLGSSSNSNPLYIYNYDYSDVLSAFAGLNHSGNTVGIGMTQWTYYTYFDASRAGSYAWYLTNNQAYWNTDKKACIMYIELKLMQQSAAGVEAHANDSTTLPSYGDNHATWTWDQLYAGCGATTAEEKKAARAAAWYLWTHERPSNYTTLEKAVGRATNAVNALRRM